MAALEQAAGGIPGAVQAAVDAALQQVAQAHTLSRKNAVPKLFGDGHHGDRNGRLAGSCWLSATATSRRRRRWAAGSSPGPATTASGRRRLATQTGTSGGFLAGRGFTPA
ncbi:MAG: hypothetical protein U0736_19370 [Gemmataceae bacterium]